MPSQLLSPRVSTIRMAAPTARRASPLARGAGATARAAAAALLLAGVAGCSADPFNGRYDLPESADVEASPWPRLVDAPAPAPTTGPTGVPTLTAKGDRLEGELGDEAADLRAAEEALRARPVVPDDLEAEKASIRAETRRLLESE